MAKCKTRTQLAKEYGVSRRTFYAMLKEADIELSSGKITPADQQKIYEKLGRPTKTSTNK